MRYTILISLTLGALNLFSQDPDSAQYFRQEAMRALEYNHFSTAENYLEKCIAQDSLNANAYYLLAKILLQSGKKTESESAINATLELDSTYVPALETKAKLMAARYRIMEALAIYDRLISQDSLNPYYPKEAGEMAYKASLPMESFLYYSKALELDAEYVQVYIALTSMLLDSRNYQESDSLIELGLAKFPEATELKILSAKSAFEQRKYSEVVTVLDSLKNRRRSGMEMRMYGLSLYELGKYQEALEVLRILSNQEHQLDFPNYYMGLCMLKLGQKEYAEMQFTQAVNKALSPNLGTYYFELGQTQLDLGAYPDAIANLRMAEKFSATSKIRFSLARAYDLYYSDRRSVLKAYEHYLAYEEDSLAESVVFTEARIEELKREIHFSEE